MEKEVVKDKNMGDGWKVLEIVYCVCRPKIIAVLFCILELTILCTIKGDLWRISYMYMLTPYDGMNGGLTC